MIMAPMASDREKNICPPAVARTAPMLGADSMKPPATAYPGTNMNFRPSMAPSMDRLLMMMMTSMKNSAGIPTVLNFSMPPEMPPRLMR